jgi:pimeloyl-ACP methyl ester carboxylesterase
MRWKWIMVLVMLVFFCLPGMAVRAAEVGREDLYLATGLISMASYSDEMNILTRQWLQGIGWTFAAQENINSIAEGRFQLASRELPDHTEMYILVFPGTERLKDAEVDLRLSRVYFAGTNPDAFKAAAAESGHNGSDPLVHQGFNDYTRVALFQKKLPAFGDKTAGEVIAALLKDNPQSVLYLTGHSLGGAVATLTAARLADMGVRPEQLQVVTFGAPAVGNKAFARAYEKRMNLTRIVMDGDPVKSVLQSLSGGFVQFGQRITWEKNHNSERFAHDMVVYLDQALRNYQDAYPLAEKPSAVLSGQARQLSGGLYVAPVQFAVDDHIVADEPYMQRIMHQMLQMDYTPVVFASAQQPDTFASWQSDARLAGCQYILLQRLQAKRIRDERYSFRLSLEEELYDRQGNLLTMQSVSATTHDLTPIEVAGYLQYRAAAQRNVYLK